LTFAVRFTEQSGNPILSLRQAKFLKNFYFRGLIFPFFEPL
jgi:hypothetical protein